MNRKSLYLLVICIASLVSCGSNSKKDPIAPEPPKAVQPYSFFNATTPLTVYREAEDENKTNEYKLSVQLLKYNLVAPGVSIQMKPFDNKYGTLEESIVDTDENGMAIFTYYPPEGNNYNLIYGQNISVEAVMLALENENETSSEPEENPPSILLTQSFVLQYR